MPAPTRGTTGRRSPGYGSSPPARDEVLVVLDRRSIAEDIVGMDDEERPAAVLLDTLHGSRDVRSQQLRAPRAGELVNYVDRRTVRPESSLRQRLRLRQRRSAQHFRPGRDVPVVPDRCYAVYDPAWADVTNDEGVAAASASRHYARDVRYALAGSVEPAEQGSILMILEQSLEPCQGRHSGLA